MNHLGTYATYIQVNVPNFLILHKFQNLTKIVQHQTTDLIVWLIQSHPKPKCSTFDKKKTPLSGP